MHVWGGAGSTSEGVSRRATSRPRLWQNQERCNAGLTSPGHAHVVAGHSPHPSADEGRSGQRAAAWRRSQRHPMPDVHDLVTGPCRWPCRSPRCRRQSCRHTCCPRQHPAATGAAMMTVRGVGGVVPLSQATTSSNYSNPCGWLTPSCVPAGCDSSQPS